MKHVHFFKSAFAILISSVLLATLSACSQHGRVSDVPDNSVPSSDKSASTQTSNTESSQPSAIASDAKDQENNVNFIPEEYKMSVYTEAPNKNSTIKIQYPIFSGKDLDVLNTLIYDKVQSFAKIDTSLFSSDTGLNIDYQSAVTLQNNKIVSIVFWGSSYIEGGAYPVDNLLPLNIDLQSKKEITLKDLYTTDNEFEKVFFEKSYFPTEPITSYDKESFRQMRELQSADYQTVDPFSIPDNVSCFLKTDGIVLSLPAVHATGSDHFEAQLNYSDIQQFYLPDQNYWED